MKGKLYLRSYYEGKMENVININIARGDMSGFKNKMINLAPSKELFDWYLKNKNTYNWFKHYRRIYLNQLKVNELALDDLSFIRDKLDEGYDVCIYCFCKSFIKCHRNIIGDLFVKKGYSVDFK